MEYKKEFDEFIKTLVSRNASDLHLTTGSKPMFRVYRSLYPLIQKDVLTPVDTERFLKLLITEEQFQMLQRSRRLLFSYEHETGEGSSLRLRGTAYYEGGTIAVALRTIKKVDKSIEELGLPSMLRTIASKKQGLFLIVGPAGQGKSTTLAAMVNAVNENSKRNIITIENPIEFVYDSKESMINQREIPRDVLSYRSGIDTALRSDADILMIGEMREVETMRSVITAAEVGHLVFSTLHTNSASQTIHRIVDSFEATQQNQIRLQLAQTLLGVFSIRLLPHKNEGLIPAYEMLLSNHAVANLIRENKIATIDSVIQTSSGEGMVSLNRSLVNLVRENKITMDTANEYSPDKEALKALI